MKITIVIRLLAFLALLFIITTSYTGTNAFGRPWYSYLKKK